MTRSTIGGPVDYARLAQLHKPSDPAAIEREVRRLHAEGLTARDIAVALRLAPDVVINMLKGN
jgi:hypothetical protein